MTSHIEFLKMENVDLKDKNKKLMKHFGHNRAEDPMPSALLKGMKIILDSA